jgi:DNA-binding transcriptional ArsR family regulator
MDSLEPQSAVRKTALTSHVLELIAERFKVLGEPARLEILNALRGGERTVTQLVADTGLGQANLSKHLQLLHAQGFVARRKEGVSVYYALADQSVFRLCDIMCDRIGQQAASRRRLLAS